MMADPKRIARIKIRCRCGKKVKIPGEFAGQVGKCPECGRLIQVPTLEEIWRFKEESERTETAKLTASGSHPRVRVDAGGLEATVEEDGGTGEERSSEAEERAPDLDSDRALPDPQSLPSDVLVSATAPEPCAAEEAAPQAALPAPAPVPPSPPPPPPPPPPSPEERALELVSQARLAAARDEHERARVLFDDALAADPDCAPAAFHRGLSELELEDFDAALQDLSRAIERRHRARDARRLRIDTLRRLGREEELLRELGLAMEEEPERCLPILQERIRLHEKRGDDVALRRDLDLLAGPTPSARLRTERGLLFARKGWIEDAKREFEEALRMEPDRLDALVNLGNLALRSRDFDRAIANYERALALRPRDVQILTNLSVCYRDRTPSQPDKARSLLRESSRPRAGLLHPPPRKAPGFVATTRGDDAIEIEPDPE